jgi:hypothetical protein
MEMIKEFCGKRIDEMDKDELLLVVDWAYDEIFRLKASEQKYAMGLFVEERK